VFLIIAKKMGWEIDQEKTVEVRKTRPKIDEPFKCYIYETKGKLRWCNKCNNTDCERPYPNCACYEGWGKVIGEIVCDRILRFDDYFFESSMSYEIYDEYKSTCLNWKEMNDYANGKETLYGWHISNLVIYDEPKDLGEFRKPCNSNKTCGFCDRHNPFTHLCRNEVTRPPQSWCYVEELGV
jgi:predicted transcriptional regulator